MPSFNPLTNPNSAAGLPRPRFSASAKTRSFSIFDPGPVGSVRAEIPVPVGTNFIWDTLSLEVGYARLIKGRYAEVLVPLGAPAPALPPGADKNEWQDITVSKVFLDGFDDHPAALRRMSLTGSVVPIEMESLHRMLSFKKEIQAGQLAVLKIHEFHDVGTGYGILGAPTLEIVGYVDRDEDLFGPPLIPPPPPIVGTTYITPPQIPASPETPAVEPVKPPASDLLARFRSTAPKVGSRAPY